MLLVDKNHGGIFLRPHKDGPVAGRLEGMFPAFAKRITAEVEIAHEEAGPFEFALVLVRPEQRIDWNKDISSQAAAWSGWKRVTETFTVDDAGRITKIVAGFSLPHRV